MRIPCAGDSKRALERVANPQTTSQTVLAAYLYLHQFGPDGLKQFVTRYDLPPQAPFTRVIGTAWPEFIPLMLQHAPQVSR